MSKIKVFGITLDSGDPAALAEFYANLLGGEVVAHGHITSVAVPELGIGITLQFCEGYQRPVWPEEPGAQQQQMHFDLVVEDLEEAVAFATGLGATKAPQQFFPQFTVMQDPAGHPFCLLPKSMFE